MSIGNISWEVKAASV